MTIKMDLPAELREVEAALAARPLPEPDSAARGRILAGVRSELALKARPAPPSMWGFAWKAAAVFLLWVNLSISAVNWTEFRLSPGESQVDEQTAVAEVQSLIPGCTVEEARRQVLLFRAGARLAKAPAPLHGRLDVGRDL